MRTRTEVSAEKLRGGYYTPPALVEFCLERVAPLLGDRPVDAMLEPSAGDGSFIRGLARPRSPLRNRVESVHAVELIPEEAAKVELSLRAGGQAGAVECGSILGWALETDSWFDLAVGNPPFVRYQFIPEDDKRATAVLAERLGVRLGGVANLWIAVLLASLSRLRPDGAAVFVLPTECFTGMSARAVRAWLSRHMSDLTFDLFPPGSFPGVLQEIAVMSGRRRAQPNEGPIEIAMNEHASSGPARRWLYRPRSEEKNWTRSLLDPHHVDALDAAWALPSVKALGSIARLEVSIVTGANEFFCVDAATLAEYELHDWARPLLARSRHAPGLEFGVADHREAAESGAKAWLLDFDARAPDPAEHALARRYLESGIEQGLPGRYKCRIRDPWYRVPSVRTGPLLLSKRSHLFPRLLMNEAQAFTTDTIYRGDLSGDSGVAPRDLVAGFHSSLTLLTVELEGRSFGGGVLELVPSEIARLAVVAHAGLGQDLERLDAVGRSNDPEALVQETDLLLRARGLIPGDLLAVLGEARHSLLARRVERNLVSGSGVTAEHAVAA